MTAPFCRQKCLMTKVRSSTIPRSAAIGPYPLISQVNSATRKVTMSRPRSYDVAMLRLVLLLAAAALVGCAGSGLAPVATDQVRAHFPPGGVVDVIEVDAVDRLPLRKAELIATDGRAIAASYLNVNPSPGVTVDPEFSSSPGYGFGTGNIGPHQTLGGAQQRVAVLAMVSTASIPLP